MNCRQTRQLVSAYLDQELTGQEMLEIHAHIRSCTPCAQEWREISEVRRLLRALPLYSPTAGAQQRLAQRLAQPDEPIWAAWAAGLTSIALTFPGVSTVRPRGRPLAAALALSSLVLFAFAQPGPPRLGDAAAPNAGVVTAMPPVRASLIPLTAQEWSGGLFPAVHLTDDMAVTPHAAPIEYGASEAEPLRDQTAVDFVQGNVALADYQAASAGTR